MLHAKIFRCLLLNWFHWAKICIGIPRKIFLQWVKWIYKEETFKDRSVLVYVTRCIFVASRRDIKNFDPKIKENFLKVFKFAVAVCTSELNIVLMLWISEFNSYKSLFMATSNKREKICRDFNGRIFRFSHNWWQESLFLAFIIILITLYLILKISGLYAELPHQIMLYNRM
jgi:hypothetical protein